MIGKLSKAERLHSRKSIEFLFRQGRTFMIPPLRMVYMISPDNDSAPVKVAFSVPKKLFKKAVERNLLKRRLREAYRGSKESLINLAVAHSLQVKCIFIYQSKDIADYKMIQAALKVLLVKLGDFTKESVDRD